MYDTRPNLSYYNLSDLGSPLTVVTDFSIIHPDHINYDGRGSAGWRTTIVDYSKLLLFFKTGEYNGTSLLSQSTFDLINTDYGDHYGLSFYLYFRNDYTGLSSNIYNIDPLPSIGSYSVLYFNEYFGVAMLSHSHLLHSEYQDDADRFFEHIETAMKKLNPSVYTEEPTPTPTSTNETNYNILVAVLMLIFVPISRVLRIRKKRK
jgi:hypothetical protein